MPMGVPDVFLQIGSMEPEMPPHMAMGYLVPGGKFIDHVFADA